MLACFNIDCIFSCAAKLVAATQAELVAVTKPVAAAAELVAAKPVAAAEAELVAAQNCPLSSHHE